ncbi:adenosine kinase [Drosophila ficusphila]|uniref:adenosine kinase n=1 Tax=Drosophila ficusphila TaxID=30025 RepID=UPI0007E6451F|nr:adenosine kinase [Drosophila ficusphila]
MEYLSYVYEKIFGGSPPTTDDTEGAFHTPRKVICFGNVLLDRLVKLEDPQLLERYGLELGSKGELDMEKLNQLAAEASESSQCLTNPGGSALNTARILKQLGTDALFFGAVGADKHAEELRLIFRERGIEAMLQTVEEAHTGQCLCLVYQDNPTLYANIGASAQFEVQTLSHAVSHEGQSFLRPVERKQILYLEGFFVPQRSEVCDYIVQHLVRERRRLALNLSAPYIVKKNPQAMLRLARVAFFLFGNRQEFEALAEAAGGFRDVDELAQHLLQSGGTKVIFVTNGSAGVQVITNYVEELAPPGPVSFEDYRAQRVEQVVDATGAGDAFVAGFLHAWLEKRSLGECIRMASNVAAKVVTQVGCNLP